MVYLEDRCSVVRILGADTDCSVYQRRVHAKCMYSSCRHVDAAQVGTRLADHHGAARHVLEAHLADCSCDGPVTGAVVHAAAQRWRGLSLTWTDLSQFLSAPNRYEIGGICTIQTTSYLQLITVHCNILFLLEYLLSLHWSGLVISAFSRLSAGQTADRA